MNKINVQNAIEAHGFMFEKKNNREMAQLTQGIRIWLQKSGIGLVCGNGKNSDKIARSVYKRSLEELCGLLRGTSPKSTASHKQINISYSDVTEETIEIILEPHIDSQP